MGRGHASGDGRSTTTLLGRARECEALDELVTAIGRGESRSLVLVGEAGIGKSALLAHLISRATDTTVLRAAGVESEMELAFATLHQLCAPRLDRLAELSAACVTCSWIVNSKSSSAGGQARPRTISSSASPSSACSPTWRRSVLSSASLMTPSGSTAPRR